MIIVNYRPLSAETAGQMVTGGRHTQAILKAMAESRDSYDFPNIDLLAFTVSLRDHTVQAAYLMAEGRARFATFYHSKCNETYWRLTSEGGFDLRSDVSPSAAILDIFNNSGQYAFECATAMVIILLRAVHDTIGTERFDALYRHLYLWDWNEEEHLPLVIEPIADVGIPGDVRYFKNPEVNPKTPWWQGENAIELPGGRYFGHGIGIKTANEMVADLNQNRRPGAEISAYLMKRATRLLYSNIYLLSRERVSGWTRPWRRDVSRFKRQSFIPSY